jgi:hypothetical protein
LALISKTNKLEVRPWKFPDVTFSDFLSAQPVGRR